MTEAYVNRAKKVFYDTEIGQTGLTDVLFTIYNPAGTQIAGSPFTATEPNSDGIYEVTFTPIAAGTHKVVVNSLLASPAITNKAGVVEVHENIFGGTFDDSTDNLEAIRDAITTLEGKVDTVDTVVDGIVVDVATVDGKVDVVDTVVDGIVVDVATVDGKIDAVEAKVDIVDTVVDGIDVKVDALDTAIASIAGAERGKIL